MEYLDIVDENGVPTGKIAERTAAHKQGLRHRTSHVWILRERAGKVEVLLQKRSQNQDSFPGCYDISSAGHIPAGVDFIPSALRELKEELGCSVSENELIYCGQRRFSYDGVFHGKEFHDRQVSNVYALWLDRRPEDFVLQKEELEEVRWFEFESCLRLVEKNEIPHCIYLEELQMLLPEVRKRERLCILVTPPVTEEEKQQLLQAAPGQKFFFTEKPEVTEEQLRRADIILGNLQSPLQLKKCENLKWIQLNNAGTEGYCEPGLLPEGAQLANATGAYGMAISEHMIGCLFALRKKLLLYWDNQKAHCWHSEGHVKVIERSNVLVIGCGDIGMTFGRKMNALGCRVSGIRRIVSKKSDFPEWIEVMYGMDSLEELLPKADIVAMSLPGNASTYHVLSRERIALLSDNAVVLNVGRGTAIDTDALADALYTGKIAGAALDVTDPEPLPPDHRLWNAPNLLITPHVSGGFSLPETLEKIVRLFADNLERYFAGQPIENLVNLQTGYRE